jgi:hypothetical protein
MRKVTKKWGENEKRKNVRQEDEERREENELNI